MFGATLASWVNPSNIGGSFHDTQQSQLFGPNLAQLPCD